jgi:hypothetical protein
VSNLRGTDPRSTAFERKISRGDMFLVVGHDVTGGDEEDEAVKTNFVEIGLPGACYPSSHTRLADIYRKTARVCELLGARSNFASKRYRELCDEAKVDVLKEKDRAKRTEIARQVDEEARQKFPVEGELLPPSKKK